MQSIKILFFLAVWKRPEITEICFKGLNRLKKNKKFEVDALAVISEESMIDLCEKYGIRWVMHENLPLGRKKNFGLSEALKLEFDYLIELGSDDLIKDELLDLYEPLFNKGVKMIGINKFSFIDTKTGECKLYSSNKAGTFGLARAFKKEVLEKLPQLWPDNANKGLDHSSHFNLAMMGVFGKKVFTDKILAIDLKSDVNIWSFDSLEGTPVSFEEATNGLSKEEINAIRNLCLVKEESGN